MGFSRTMFRKLCHSYTVRTVGAAIEGQATCGVCDLQVKGVETRFWRSTEDEIETTSDEEAAKHVDSIDACWPCRKLAEQAVLSGRYKPDPDIRTGKAREVARA